MEMIEPNVYALLWFCLFAGMTSLGFYVLTGAFPLETRPDLTARPTGLVLLGLALILLLVAGIGGVLYALDNLRWTSLVIVIGLAFLFAPGVFNIWPARWRDGTVGLAIVCAGLALTVLAQQTVGGVFSF